MTDLSKAEAIAYLRGGGREGGRVSEVVARQVYALVGGRLADLARVVEMMDGEGWGFEGRREGGREGGKEGGW